MEKVEQAKEELFKLLDKFCKSLAERGITRDELRAVLTLDRHEISDTVDTAFGD